ncbi:MAG: DUF4292 domain-containing protein [Bacteroidota bacterium]
MINKLCLLASLIILFASGACSKKVSGIGSVDDSNQLDVQQVDFNYFSGKAKINYKDSELDLKAKANVRMKKDSLIWISFSAVGIQGARCLISKDSITILNMFKKEYYVYHYDSLSAQFNINIDFESIQSAAVGNLVQLNEKDDNVEKTEDFFILHQRSGSILIDNFVNPQTMKVERVQMIENESKNSATINYYDFQMVENQAFPFSAVISLFYKADNKTLNTLIEFEYNKAVIEDKELKFPFNIPKKYVRR